MSCIIMVNSATATNKKQGRAQDDQCAIANAIVMAAIATPPAGQQQAQESADQSDVPTKKKPPPLEAEFLML